MNERWSFTLSLLRILLLGTFIAFANLAKANDPAQMEGRLISGEKFNLTQWKGKVVMLNFWATWCGVCKSEMPDWQALYERNKDKGFQMLAVSIDDEEPDIKAFVASHKHYTFPVAWRFDKSEDDNLPTIYATPTTVFLGRDGKVALTRKGVIAPDELTRIVQSLL